MQTFNIQNPLDWHRISADEILQFDCPASSRKVRLTVNVTTPTSIYVADNPDMENRVLVGHASGMFEVQYSAREMTFVQFSKRGNALTYVKEHSGNQVVRSKAPVRYTTVEPNTRRNTDYDRMMHFVKMNEARRDEQMEAERQAVRRERREMRQEMRAAREAENQVIEPVTPPANETETTEKEKKVETPQEGNPEAAEAGSE